MEKKELILTLLNIKRLGRKTINSMLNYGVPNTLETKEILNYINLSKQKVKKIPKVNEYDIEEAKLKSLQIIQNCQRQNIGILTLLDEDFPKKLKIIEDNPVILYYKGDKNCLSRDSIAVIGTRKPTAHGERVSYKLSSILSQRGYCIVSGLAKGCDTFAHLGSLSVLGKTIAVMPCGLDTIYPKDNSNLFNKIIDDGGCVISEYPPGQKLFKNQLVERDRLQSALSEAVVVVETTINGGTLHTVNYAFNQNKKVACYKHSEKYIGENAVQGNLKLLESKEVTSICSIESIEQFIEKLKNQNNYDKLNQKNYIDVNQIEFKI